MQLSRFDKILRFESEPVEHPNVAGFEKCWTCGGTGWIHRAETTVSEVPRPKCYGTGIRREGQLPHS